MAVAVKMVCACILHSLAHSQVTSESLPSKRQKTSTNIYLVPSAQLLKRKAHTHSNGRAAEIASARAGASFSRAGGERQSRVHDQRPLLSGALRRPVGLCQVALEGRRAVGMKRVAARGGGHAALVRVLFSRLTTRCSPHVDQSATIVAQSFRSWCGAARPRARSQSTSRSSSPRATFRELLLRLVVVVQLSSTSPS